MNINDPEIAAGSERGDSDSNISDKENFEIEEYQNDLAGQFAASHENILVGKELVVVFTAVSMTLLVSFIDQTGITVALPDIAKDLDAYDTISWASTSALISTTVFMVLFGRFSDIFSRKYTLIFAMFILAFFDLACALAKTSTQFYIFRGFCNMGNGGISTLSMVIVSDIVTLEQRGLYQGILGAFVGVGAAIGPYISAAFIEHSSWRNFYFTLFPISLCSIAIIYQYIPYTRPKNDMKEKLLNLDYLGFFTSSIAIIFLLIPISGGGSSFPWNSAFSIAMLTIGGSFFLIFLFVEYKLAKLPLIPLQIFNQSIPLSLLLSQNFFFGVCYYGSQFYYPYYFEVVRGYSVIDTSSFMLAFVIPQTISSASSGQIISRTKQYGYVVWFGYLMWFLSTCLLNIWSISSKKGVIIIIMIINGLGSGSTFQPTLIALQSYSYKKDRATVISTRNVLRCFGGSISLAISATIVANTFLQQLNSGGSEYFTVTEIATLKTMIYSKINLAQFSTEQASYLRSVYMLAMKRIFYIWMASMAYCVVTNIPIRDRGLQPLDEQDNAYDAKN